MRDGINTDRASNNNAVNRLRPEAFLESQYRKTELRRLFKDTDAADRVGQLMRVIEADVIPQLVSARTKKAELPQPTSDATTIVAARVALFARSLIGQERAVDPFSFVSDIQAAGTTVATIYLDLLAPAARHVGALWDDDRCTFLDVTLALGTLHRIMRSLSAELDVVDRRIDPARRVLLVQAHGSEHTFGFQMVAEFFRRGAWTVDLSAAITNHNLGRAVQTAWFTVVGFSVARETDLGILDETIRSVRKASMNPGAGILVGGPVFIDHHDYVARVGADGMATDAIHAVLEAERFVLHTPLSQMPQPGRVEQ